MIDTKIVEDFTVAEMKAIIVESFLETDQLKVSIRSLSKEDAEAYKNIYQIGFEFAFLEISFEEHCFWSNFTSLEDIKTFIDLADIWGLRLAEFGDGWSSVKGLKS